MVSRLSSSLLQRGKMNGQLTAEIRELTNHLRQEWEDLTPIDLCNNMIALQETFKLSERKLALCFDLSKSEIHRILSVAKLSDALKATCKTFGTDYHTLCLLAEAPSSGRKEELLLKVLDGTVRRHKKAKEFLGDQLRKGRKKPDVILNGIGEIKCRNCGQRGTLFKDSFSVDVMTYADSIKQWSQPHRSCKKRI